jgi:hypothetical protein
MIQLTNDILIPQIAEQIKNGYTVTLPLKGFSMRPFLEDGRDKALLVAVPAELHVGDVILAEISPQRWALHRIVNISGDDITMYGDGNFSPEYIKRKDVIALATGFYRKGKDTLDSVDSTLYIIYWKMWVRLRPVRRYLLGIWRLWHYPKATIKLISKKINKS